MISGKRWLDAKVPSLKGKRVLLTGGTSGIGFEAVQQLCYKGAAVTVACRNESKAEEARKRIRENVPEACLSFVYYDQSEPSSVAALVKRLEKEEFFAIVLNAGVFNPAKKKAFLKDGTSLVFMTNAIGTYLLYEGLAKAHGDSRFVFVGSVASQAPRHRDYSLYVGASRGGCFHRYGVSKRAVMAIYEMAYEKTAHDVALLSPGIAKTAIIRGYPRWFLPFANGFMKTFFQPAWKAALGISLLASGEGPRGAYVAPDDWFRLDGYPRFYKPPHKKSAQGAADFIALLDSTFRP
ncbi:MAG: SDR family NAD(P)-dependent oxidoreductase [Bacilli bacterium]|jgi:NAD(P)-dependent dehydrogenase (short-subunit alcohol dehydrogenase family)|nr:SDR family NAD(P)-dependent oxidoreductase [Bacilli bacterium]